MARNHTTGFECQKLLASAFIPSPLLAQEQLDARPLPENYRLWPGVWQSSETSQGLLPLPSVNSDNGSSPLLVSFSV